VSKLESFPEQADVVVVGAGVAGLYCAWRLLEQDPSRKVVIVERLNRTGGRLDTDLIKIKGANGVATVRDEEGGMRFNYSMRELMALNGALDLCNDIVPFPMGPIPASPNYNRFSIRGRSFTVQESIENPGIWSELYTLNENEKNKPPVEIVTEVYDKIVRHNNEQAPANPTPEYWQKFRLEFKWRGTLLCQWQLGGLLREMGYSEECITMLSHTIGFEAPFLSLANAGEAFQILEDFPASPTYFTFHKGFSTLPDALKSKVKAAGGQIFLSANVDDIRQEGGDYCLDLTFAEQGQSASQFVENGVKRRIKSTQIILAVASKSMNMLYSSSAVLNAGSQAEQLLSDLQSVVDMRLLKINLYFDETWWEDTDFLSQTIQFGGSFSDLPINSVYPFYSLQGNANSENPAALTIYCDFNNTNFWQGLQNVKPDFDSPAQQRHSLPPQVVFPASQAVVKEALKQMTEMFQPKKAIPDPVMTSYRLWGGESDFGYAYHQWALNANDDEIRQRLVEPLTNIFTCNEAYSDMQGWVNGSLRSADRVLRKFDIQPLVDDDSVKACVPK